jgi:hypothetical protein
MNAQELLETYGKAATIVKAYYVEKFIESMVTENVPENYKEFARSEGIDNGTIAKMVESMPRALFDVFDSYELHIEILVMYSDKPSIFTYTVVEGDLIHTQPTKYNSRIEAERVAIEEAFKLLDEQL